MKILRALSLRLLLLPMLAIVLATHGIWSTSPKTDKTIAFKVPSKTERTEERAIPNQATEERSTNSTLDARVSADGGRNTILQPGDTESPEQAIQKSLLSWAKLTFGSNTPDNIEKIITDLYYDFLHDVGNDPKAISLTLMKNEIVEYVQSAEMAKLGYNDAMEMDQYDFDTVQHLAASGDIKAIQNLADTYYFSGDDIPIALLEKKSLADYKEHAKQLYWDSLAMGSARSASVLGEIAVIEKKPTEAHAWYQLAQELQDFRFTRWYEGKDFAKQLSQAQVAESAQLASQYRSRIIARTSELNGKTLFD